MRLALLLLLLLGACSKTDLSDRVVYSSRPEFVPYNPVDKDTYGNIYPRECHDLSDVKADIYVISMVERYGKPPLPTQKQLGRWEPDRDNKWGVIYLEKDLPYPYTYADVVQHEQCHAKWYYLFGNPFWHP